jgi:hypothetical protein
MPIKSWDIVGYVGPIVYFKANIGGEAYGWRFNNLFHDA